MLNTFILMLALASNQAEAKKHHKHDARPKAKSHAEHDARPKAKSHAQVHKHKEHRHRAHYTWMWKWHAGYYDIHGHWIGGKWTYTRIII